MEAIRKNGVFLSALIADDSAVVRERLAALLREVPGVAVVAQTEDVEGTLGAIRRLRPAVVVLDINMPGGSGLDVLRGMAQERMRAVVIVLTNVALPEYEQKARALGARAFLNKSNEFMKMADLVGELSNKARHRGAAEAAQTA